MTWEMGRESCRVGMTHARWLQCMSYDRGASTQICFLPYRLPKQEGHLPLVKLCDFGFSKDKFDDSEPQTQIGTALFTAPEIFTNVPGQVGIAWHQLIAVSLMSSCVLRSAIPHTNEEMPYDAPPPEGQVRTGWPCGFK
jgi:serine/threonine protein kinase